MKGFLSQPDWPCLGQEDGRRQGPLELALELKLEIGSEIWDHPNSACRMEMEGQICN